MVPYSFDTEVAAKNLQNDGFTSQQASSLVKFMLDAQQELATKADLDLTKAELKAAFSELEAAFGVLRADHAEFKLEITESFGNLKTELKTEMSDLRTELKTEMSDLRTEFADLKTEFKTEISGVVNKLWNIQAIFFGCLCAFLTLLHSLLAYFS